MTALETIVCHSDLPGSQNYLSVSASSIRQGAILSILLGTCKSRNLMRRSIVVFRKKAPGERVGEFCITRMQERPSRKRMNQGSLLF